MEKKSLFQKCAGLPPPLLPTLVGAVTLSNVFQGMGFTWIRHITTCVAIIVWLFALIKIIAHSATFKNEYKNTIPASVYAGFTMLMMLFSAYLMWAFPKGELTAFASGLWLAAVCLHALHIIIFTINNVFKGVKTDTFVPSWFVTYNGILVSVVISGSIKADFVAPICRILLFYGLGIYAILIICMIIRINTKPFGQPMLHTKPIVIAPAALCTVSYINVMQANVNPTILCILWVAVFLSFLYFLKNLFVFFSLPFNPGFAGLTFPNAIGIVASMNVANWFLNAERVLLNENYKTIGNIVRQVQGIQLYITTAVIAMVLLNFLKMFLASYPKKPGAGK